MTSRREILRLAELLASAPTVSYREQEVLLRVRSELDRAGISHATDRWGNLIARYRAPSAKGRPVAFTAHADHPGFLITSCKGRTATARWMGGVQAKYFRGARVRLETVEGTVRGRVRSVRLGANGRVASVGLSLQRPVPVGAIGNWDLPPFRLAGPWVRTKSADDLMGCAAVCALLLELAARKPRIEVWGVFTRAEEEGLLGASILAEERTLPEETAVVVLETSRELPCGKLGKGPIVRVGDRRSVYDPGVSQGLHEAAMDLAKKLRGFKYQRGLMDGGVCEATAFQAFGYAAGGLALALGNYHNMGPRNAIGEEFVHRDDLTNLVRLLPVAAERIASVTDGLAGLRASLRKGLARARKELASSRALAPPPAPRRARRPRASVPTGRGLVTLALAAAIGLLGGAGISQGSQRPWWTVPLSERSEGKPLPRGALRAAAVDAPDPRDEYDALHYDLSLRLDPDLGTISGSVTMRIHSIVDLTRIVVDMGESLSPDSVAIDGTPVTPSRPVADQIELSPRDPIPEGTDVDLLIRYHGTPGGSFFGSVEFYSNHGAGTDSFPVISSLSQPDLSHAWWPCKDRMDDKATVSLNVETPAGFVVAGNGNRMRPGPGDPPGRAVWQTSYPIAPYLVSIAATNYASWTGTFHAADGDSIPLEFYAFPEDSAKARADYDGVTDDALRAFEERFGPYPFRDRTIGFEKLGVAEVPWGQLAMEHQTCVSYGNGFIRGDGTYAWALAHEIAHQWWGDAVTPVSMDDIWLNEGFATYCEALLAEAQGGAAAYSAWMAKRWVPPDTDPLSPLVAPDPAYWFLRSLTYHKGAWVLHMLRGILGDAAFFESLNAYLARHIYGNATTEEFMRAVEETAGRDLRWFFLPWLYGASRPVIAWDWSPNESMGRHQVRLLVTQTQPSLEYPKGAPEVDPPEHFAFPLEVRIFGAGDSLTRTLFVGERTAVAVIDSIPFAPERVVLDPQELFLREIIPQGTGIAPEPVRVWPNPSRGGAVFLVRAAGSGETRVTLYDVAGRRVRGFPAVSGTGFHEVRWDGSDDHGSRLASGLYFLRITGPGGSGTTRVAIAR